MTSYIDSWWDSLDHSTKQAVKKKYDEYEWLFGDEDDDEIELTVHPAPQRLGFVQSKEPGLDYSISPHTTYTPVREKGSPRP